MRRLNWRATRSGSVSTRRSAASPTSTPPSGPTYTTDGTAAWRVPRLTMIARSSPPHGRGSPGRAEIDPELVGHAMPTPCRPPEARRSLGKRRRDRRLTPSVRRESPPDDRLRSSSASTGITDAVLVGRGGYGSCTALARSASTGRSRSRCSTGELDEAAAVRFERECAAMGSLSGHPHIVTVFDSGIAAGQPYIIMEYLPGGSLHDLLVAGPGAVGRRARLRGEARRRARELAPRGCAASGREAREHPACRRGVNLISATSASPA